MLAALPETFRTDLVPRPRRLTFWNDIAVRTFGEIAVDALSPDFSAQLTRVRFGGLTLASVTSSAARVHGAASGSAASDGWFLLLNEHGTSCMQQGAREVLLQPGELTALRADERYRIEFSRPNKTIVLHLPGDARRIDLDRHIARKHTSNDAPLLTALLRQLESVKDGAELQRFERLANEVVTLCWPAPMSLPAATRRRQSALAWEQTLREHVGENLADPELSAVSIARQLGVTPRFIHMVFARTGQTAASFILERRLEIVAANLLSTPTARISEIALDAGFTDLSQFCRAFRKRFGINARDYRKAH